jgi:hypothetical protein
MSPGKIRNFLHYACACFANRLRAFPDRRVGSFLALCALPLCYSSFPRPSSIDLDPVGTYAPPYRLSRPMQPSSQQEAAGSAGLKSIRYKELCKLTSAFTSSHFLSLFHGVAETIEKQRGKVLLRTAVHNGRLPLKCKHTVHMPTGLPACGCYLSSNMKDIGACWGLNKMACRNQVIALCYLSDYRETLSYCF